MALRGTGVGRACREHGDGHVDSPTDFGTRRIGEPPGRRRFKVTNAAAANDLTVTSVVDNRAVHGARTRHCNVPVPAGRTCRLNVTFNPTAPIGPPRPAPCDLSNVDQQPVAPGALTGTSRPRPWCVAALRIVQPATRTAVKPVNVSLNVSTAASIRLQVRKTNGKIVWSKSIKAKKAGTAKLKWNLRDAKGRKVKKGRYVFTITVTDGTGAKVVVKRTVRVR